MRSEGFVPGRVLLGWPPALAAAALAFNVFYLRKRHQGWVSGKLSDLAINFLLPVFLIAAWEWLLVLVRVLRPSMQSRVGRREIITACLVSTTYFSLLKTWPAFTAVHQGLLGILGLPLGMERFQNVADPTDLLTLVSTPLAGWYLWRSTSR